MIDFDTLLLIGAVVLIVAIVAARIGSRVGLPALLVFLVLGMVMGDSGLGVRFSDANLANDLGFAALVLILAEGGLTTKWRDIRTSVGPAVLLATVGIGVSITLMALFGYFVLGLNLWLAILLGAVTAPTDSAAVFSVLRNVPVPHRLRGVLEAESGLNDAPTVLLVGAASVAAVTGVPREGGLLLVAIIVLELVAGLLIGMALGWVGVQILRRVALPSSGLYPLATLGWAVLSYGLADLAHTSGFAAVYVCAVILGNANLPHRGATRSFVEGVGWIAQIGLFVMLGLLSTPSRLSWNVVIVALIAGLFLTFVARPLSVLTSVGPYRFPVREQIFLSWAGLRGAVPIVLATVPLSENVPNAAFLFDVVLVFVIIFTVVQGPTLPFVGRRLGLINDDTASEVEVEVAPLDKISADLLQVRIPEGSRLSGIEIAELRLPKDTVVSLIIRDATPFTPSARDRIKVGDELLVVTPTAQRDITEERLRALGRGGRLARWRGRRTPTD
jgi:potassium/hydrogen antiporter